MSTLSHNRGQERTHDPDQNTPQTLCPQRNREALVNTRQLAQNPHSVRTLAGLKTTIIHRFLSFNNWVKTHCRSNPDVTLKSQVKHHIQPWSPALKPCLEVLPWSQEQNPRRLTSSNPQENYQHTTASSLFCKKANDQVISKQKMLLQQRTADSIKRFVKFYFELSKHPFGNP